MPAKSSTVLTIRNYPFSSPSAAKSFSIQMTQVTMTKCSFAPRDPMQDEFVGQIMRTFRDYDLVLWAMNARASIYTLRHGKISLI
jgi:hypothetical protein